MARALPRYRPAKTPYVGLQVREFHGKHAVVIVREVKLDKWAWVPDKCKTFLTADVNEDGSLGLLSRSDIHEAAIEEALTGLSQEAQAA